MRSALALLLGVVFWLAVSAGAVSASSTSVSVDEHCSYRLLPNDEVLLTTRLTIQNARDGRSAQVRLVAGWNTGKLYPKASTAIVVRLSPGYRVRRTVSRRMKRAPVLWRALYAAKRINCASSVSYTLG